MDVDAGDIEALPVLLPKLSPGRNEEGICPEPGDSKPVKCDKMSLEFILNPCTSIGMPCLICREIYPSGAKLRAHLCNAHGQKPTLECPHCYKKFTGFNSLLRHIAVSNMFTTLIGGIFTDLTSPSMPNISLFFMQQNEHTRGTNKVFCERCAFVADSEEAFSAHCQALHMKCQYCSQLVDNLHEHEEICEHLSTL